MRKILDTWTNQRGLGVDEAILSIAMVTSLGAFVAINVPWGNFFSASSQMQGELQQIETANREFYSRHQIWPHQTTNGDWKRNVSALVSTRAMRYPYNTMTSFKNLLPDFKTDAKMAEVRHAFGKGGAIMQRPVSFQGKEYIEIILENVPISDARDLDEKIDGAYDPDNGQMYLVFDKDKITVDVHYRANPI